MPSFAMYSGYVTVDASAGRNLFYWLVQSAGDPATDPLVAWFTGGPGCSSLFALTTEHGPVLVNATDPSSLYVNPYSWNARANMLYIEAPGCVGFSYAENGNCTTGDGQVAVDNYNFLVGFLAQYPEYRGRDLYLSGESYAGHYVPQLAQQIVNNPSPGLSLRGFVVGNPSFDGYYDYQNGLAFMTYHGLVATAEYMQAYAICNGTFAGPVSPACANATASIRPLFVGLNPYNIYEPCHGPPSLDGGCLTTATLAAAAAKAPSALRHEHVIVSGPSLSQTVVPCINVSGPVYYFNQASVRDALHVSPLAASWDVCSPQVNYTQYAYSVRQIYQNLADSLRILVFSGDADTCVPYLGTEAAMDSLGFPVAAPGYRQWHINDTVTGQQQVAGYVREYVTTGGQLRYATAKGGGHMLATWAPVQALHLFTSYITNGQL